MNERYAESGVKCVLTSTDIGKIVGFVVLIVVSILAAMVISPLVLIVTVGLTTYGVWKAAQVKYEYEYIFCDGQLDFDKIMGNIRRKRMMRVQFENCEVIAPEGSMALDAWKNKSLKVYDFTSHKNEKKPFVIIAHKDQELVKILFEPNDNMVSCMRDKSRKLVQVQ